MIWFVVNIAGIIYLLTAIFLLGFFNVVVICWSIIIYENYIPNLVFFEIFFGLATISEIYCIFRDPGAIPLNYEIDINNFPFRLKRYCIAKNIPSNPSCETSFDSKSKLKEYHSKGKIQKI